MAFRHAFQPTRSNYKNKRRGTNMINKTILKAEQPGQPIHPDDAGRIFMGRSNDENTLQSQNIALRSVSCLFVLIAFLSSPSQFCLFSTFLVHRPKMADFISPIFNALSCLCGYCAIRVDSIRKLGENLSSLGNASNQLKSMYLDVKMKVDTAEQDPDPELMVLNVVKDWMGRVEDLQNEVQAILQKGDQANQATCLGGRCPKNCRANYKLHKVVTQKLSDVNSLISRGHFDVVAEKFARDRFDELPVDKVVGVESTFKELCSCFENNQVGVIGLYGMGGVGKTTLLKKFNNEFLSKKAHMVVIWVVVSKDVNMGKIQENIRKKLRVQDHIWDDKSMEDRAILLLNILKKKKFVLLLDDVWYRIDLLKLGVPSPNNHECKIIFTTRLENICGLMKAQTRINVKCLKPDEAFELFKDKVGETTLEDPNILPLAKQVVDECQELPLALCIVGRAMASIMPTPNEWSRALEILRSHPSRVSGMVEDVYYLLEFSYDKLSSGTHKSCFLYCSLFPEDYNIKIEELILLWIAEGFLAEFDDDICEAWKQGEDIISNLKQACLLENGDYKSTIKMHDVIRDMALWVACDHGTKTKFVVKNCSDGTRGLEVSNHEKWKEIEKLSLWGRGRGRMNLNLPQKPHYPNLLTMLIRDTTLQVGFPTQLFDLPCTMRVLDLSSNRGMSNIPSAIGDFVLLEHMNLSGTGITRLPEELKNLKKLRHLLLDGVGYLEFPRGIISSLSSLQVFSMFDGGEIKRLTKRHPKYDENDLLDELEGLDHLQDIRISIDSPSSVQKILTSSKLLRCMRHLEHIKRDSFKSRPVKVKHEIETFPFHGGPLIIEDTTSEVSEAENIPRRSFWGYEYIIILRKLTLFGCENIVDLNWLIHAPDLEFLALSDCYSLVEVITDDFGTVDTETVKSNLFCSLTYLDLKNLTELRSICRMALQFPCLKEITVNNCSRLRKLPFNSQSGLKNLQNFDGERQWLNKLEDEAAKHLLTSKFKAHDYS
ncbi:probable disease resistance protein At5g63020 [Prosopis cineraria]|uniref:probable disease resistance protein At5g63020 n=1 Tax=Prosopis cineraria TaxID=364024 RepID=UPI00241047DC|nr:probable disease resistance protein At5g63020 [Prosopis cineraria]